MAEPTPLPCAQCGSPVVVERILAPRTRGGIRPSVGIRRCTNKACRSTSVNRPEREKS